MAYYEAFGMKSAHIHKSQVYLAGEKMTLLSLIIMSSWNKGQVKPLEKVLRIKKFFKKGMLRLISMLTPDNPKLISSNQDHFRHTAPVVPINKNAIIGQD